MNGHPNPMSTTLEFLRDPETSDYVLATVVGGTGCRVSAMCLTTGVMEQDLVRDLSVAMELRPDGTVVAFADTGATPDLAAKTLTDLIGEALSVVSPEDDAEDLAKLEQMLEASLVAVQQERQRLAARSGR